LATKPTLAFLSHATADKPFVEAVAKRLGRQQVQFDKWVFDVGEDFESAIQAALGKSAVFVLFASKASLASYWVKFEAKHAKALIGSKVMENAMVFVIDPDVSHADLPKWMQKSLVRPLQSAAAVASSIQHRLAQLRGVGQESYFFGREETMKEFGEKLIPAGGSPPPHLIIVGGLSGVGRKTVLAHGLQDFMSMRMSDPIHLRQTDSLDALHFALLDYLGRFDAKADLAEAIADFQAADLETQAGILADLLLEASAGNVAPCIVDEGSFLQSNSSYVPAAMALFAELKKHPELVVAIVHTRRPRLSDRDFGELHACYIKIPPIDIESTRRLLTKKLGSLATDASHVEHIASYLNGYPPAISLAAEYCKEYGVATLTRDIRTLVNFQVQTFAEVLVKLNLSELEWKALRFLAAGLELPLDALAIALKADPDDIVPNLKRLIDFNLVLSTGANFSIAYPVRFAVQAAKGPILPPEFEEIGRRLKETYWDGKDSLPPYSILESTVNALLRSDSKDLSDFKGFVVPSSLYRAAKECYEQWGHDNWIAARNLLDQLLTLSPNHPGGLVLMAKILIRLNFWKDADTILVRIRERKLPEQHFLQGFMLWKQRHYEKAIPHFRTALNLGQGAVEIYHALAICLFRLNRLKEAGAVLREGLEKRPRPNSLLLDVAAQIAIASGNLDEAEGYVEKLRLLNVGSDYHHRAATLLNARKLPHEALAHAREALNSPRQRFEVETVLINTLIETKELEEAAIRLGELDNKYGAEGSRRDVRLGLRCKLELRLGHWQVAEALWEDLSEKTSPVHLALRRELLEQKIKDKKLSESARQEAQSLLRNVTLDSIFLDLTDDVSAQEEEDSEQMAA
jgi:tetratricopeptide (TPR) repeat protein